MGVPATPPPEASMEIGEGVTLRPVNAINRDTPRYVLYAGDRMPPATKRNFADKPGVNLGGELYSLIDVPTLWKFQGFLSRGRLTPLLKHAVIAFDAEEIVKKKAKEVAEIRTSTDQVISMPEVRRTVFPWDGLQTLMQEVNQRRGATHVAALDGIEWNAGIVQEIQRHFFPNWAELESGSGELPFTVNAFRRHIESRIAASSESTIQNVGAAYMEAIEKFEIFANRTVDSAVDGVRRGMNEKGWSQTYTDYHRHLAAQIEKDLDNSPKVIVQGGASAPAPAQGMSEAEIALKTREIEAMEESNRLKAVELGKGLRPGLDPKEGKAKPQAKAKNEPTETEDADNGKTDE